MEPGKWNSLSLEEKVEALRELVELLTGLVLEISTGFDEIVKHAVNEFEKRYASLEEELFGKSEEVV